MAESLLTPYTSHVLSQILAAEPQYGGSIGRAAAWADEFAHTEEGKYSGQWHWVDSADHVSTYLIFPPYFYKCISMLMMDGMGVCVL